MTTGLIDAVPVWLLGVVALVGIVIGAVLSAAEAALHRITRAAATEMRHAGRPRAAVVARLVEDRRSALAGVSFVRLLAEMTAAVCLTLVVADLLSPWWLVLLVAVATTALVVAVLVGSSPRELGRRHPDRVLHALAGPVTLMTVLARPLVSAGDWLRPTPVRSEEEEREDRADDLKDMVDLVSENEHIEDEQRDLLQSVFELGRTLTREVMVPRTDVITTGIDTPLDKAIGLFIRSGFSRIPVIGDTVDDVRGVLFLKDALRAERRAGRALTAADVMRPARLVPEMKRVDDLMREMQTESTHIAVVIDGYGGVAGIVTMEDLMEELVGEVQDEHDADLPEVEDLGDGTFRIPARLPVDELGDLFDLDLDDEDVDTAGGLLAKALGKVPIEGSGAEVLGLRLTAERSGGRRRQIVTMIAAPATAPTEDE